MSDVAQAILAAAAVVTALGVLWRWSHLGDLLRDFREFLLNWHGTPERPGVEAVPSIPHRLAEVERRTEVTDQRTADLNHELRGELVSRLELLAHGQEQLQDAVQGNRGALDRLDERVTDHRRRNEAQIELLRADVDRRLSSISGDLLRAETYRAALQELGLDIDPPARRNTLQRPPHAPLEDTE